MLPDGRITQHQQRLFIIVTEAFKRLHVRAETFEGQGSDKLDELLEPHLLLCLLDVSRFPAFTPDDLLQQTGLRLHVYPFRCI
jgi:hypothetical protein